MDDIEIIKRAQKGDDEAFTKLMDLCKQKLYRVAYAYLKNEQNSLDVVSETVYKAYININKLKTAEYFNTWIVKILINSCKNVLKTNKKVIYIDECVKIDEEREIAEETEFKIASNIDIFNAIDNLNDKFKSIIILKYFEDMTIAQISEVLDYPEGTVKVYLRRALAVLKIQLKEGYM